MRALLIAAVLQLAPVQAPRELPLNGIQRARAFDVDPTGERIAVGYQDGRVLLVAARDAATVRELAPAGPAVPWTVRFSPDGERLACVDHDGGLRILELASDAPVATHRAFPDRGRRQEHDSFALLSWSPTSKHLLVGDRLGATGLWTAGGEFVRRLILTEPRGTPEAAWSADGSTLFVADGARVRALAASDGKERSGAATVRSIECGATIAAFAIHPDGAQMVTGHDDGRLFTWDLASGLKVSTDRLADGWDHDPGDFIADFAYSPAGDRLAYSTRACSRPSVFELASRASARTDESRLGTQSRDVGRFVWDPRGASLWFSSCDGTLHRRDADGTLAKLGEVFVPRFGGNVAVTIANGDLVAFDLDGQRRWRRVERRYGERTAFEILDQRGR